jgi:uncharacterized membrane protein YfcA
VDLMTGWSPSDREAVLHAVVGGGAAMLLAYAMFAHATDRASPAHVRALAAAGVGFLMSAGASLYLRERSVAGPAVSLAGCVVVIGAMRALLRERIERQAAARRAARPPAGE